MIQDLLRKSPENPTFSPGLNGLAHYAWKASKKLFVSLVALSYISCASMSNTKPNISLIDKNGTTIEHSTAQSQQDGQRLLYNLAQKNPLLAHEFGKIPEFQDGLSKEETSALENIVSHYSNTPDLFDNTFKQMYQIGIPEVRKYCSPLQALFWLAEDGKSKDVFSVIKDYSLNNLLNKAWGHKFSLTDEEIDIVIDNITNKGRKEGYIKDKEYYRTRDNYNKMMNLSIKRDYARGSSVFSSKAMKIINKQFQNINLRWDKFNTVADRLNAPELIHYYINNNFRYMRGDFPPAYTTFTRKYGNCTALADFGKFLLKRAGYETFVRTVYTTGRGSASEHTGSGIDFGNDKYQLVVNFGKAGNRRITKPIDLENLDLSLANGNKIIRSQWGHSH